MIENINLSLPPQQAADSSQIRAALSRQMRIRPEEINDFRVVRRSIDARQRQVKVNLVVRTATGDDRSVAIQSLEIVYKNVDEASERILIVGAGPAGLFAALKALEYGIKPILFERGKDVDSRRKDLAAISREGRVDPDSNYCFGEGGAGAYSDGKLFTRSKKRGDVSHVLHVLHNHGASADILVDAHPHIGTDRLPGVIRSIRETIISHGGEVHFSEKVTELLLKGNRIAGLRLESGHDYEGSVLLATGHSARDVYRMLKRNGIKMEAKGLAIGVRMEHPQAVIDRIRYHSPQGRGKWLPAAEYSFVEQSEGRGVYSFCMCPGGVIVPAVSAPGELVVNGMSNSSRSGRYANSGMVVEVRPGDFPEFSSEGELQMLALQESLEKTFYSAAGNTLKAPAQRLTDFLAGKISSSLPDTSYPPGIQSLPLHFLLPDFITRRLREGLRKMDRKNRGLITSEATLIGLESRTSSPVRIPRNDESLCHIEIQGLYPAGEGAGYAGGIVSAAMDGERCIEAFHNYLACKHNNSDHKISEKE